MKFEKSEKLYKLAINYIPGGVNSPVRAFGAVGGNPIFIESGKGAEITDADGNKYIDYVLSWGPLILGHSYPDIVGALENAIQKGTSFGAPTELEVELAKYIIDKVNSVERIRLVNSGTEATMTAVRLARAVTNRRMVVKFDGCYHGHSDGFLAKAGSGMLTAGIPSSSGVPRTITELIISLPYNNMESIEDIFEKRGGDIACVIVEPMAANMGVVPPENGFLEGLRKVTKEYDSLLIFDEVITGFRLGLGGAQQFYGVYPDITCFGKIIGGGLPVGAIGGRADIMDRLSPSGDVYQAGTLSGNPLAVIAGLTTLKILDNQSVYQKLETNGALLEKYIEQNLDDFGIDGVVQRVGSLLTLFFTDKAIKNFDDANTLDKKLYSEYFHSMLKRGIYLPPSPFEAMFLSVYHNEDIIERTAEAQRKAFAEIS